MVDPSDIPSIGDLVCDRTTGQVFGVKDRRRSPLGDRKYLIDENDQRHLLEDCIKLNGSEASGADIEDAIALVVEAESLFNQGHTEDAIAIVSAISAAFVIAEQKKPLWAALTTEQRELLMYFRGLRQDREAA
jgi:hypothetical protein